MCNMKNIQKKEYEIEKNEYVVAGLDKIMGDELLTKVNEQKLQDISKDLTETWRTDRMWRTETEMRYSVLEDTKHPTKGMKYLQARVEQNVHFTNLMYLACDYDETRGKLMVAEAELEILEKEQTSKMNSGYILQKKAEIQKLQFNIMEMKKAGHHRVREVSTWEKIKKELDDGSFDPNNYDEIQKTGLAQRWANQIAAQTTMGKAQNKVGPLSAITKQNDNEGNKIQ